MFRQVLPAYRCNHVLVSRYFGARSTSRKKGRFNNANETKLPQFQVLLRQLMRRSHPDLVRSANPEFAKVNDSSMQLLNGILSTIKTCGEYPRAQRTLIPFYLKTPANDYEKHELLITVSGGECSHQLKKCFESFFKKAGIADSSFEWGSEYFPIESYTTVAQEEAQA